jgi:raffinose/stachyose/melibiose transport system substrate-binding protein
MNGRLGVVALAAICVVCTACGSSSDSSGSSASASTAPASRSASGEIRLVSHSATRVGLDQLIKNFNAEYPNIKVNAQFLPTGPASPAILSMVNSGNAPDIFFTNPNPSSDVPAPELGRAGKLLDLTSEPWVRNIPDRDRRIFFVDGKVYAEPIFETASGLNTDVSMFRRFGWELPRTFDDLISLCGKAKQQGITLIAFQNQVGKEVVNALAATYVFSRNPNWIQDRIAGRVKFASSPEWRTVFERLEQMRDAGCFQDGWQAAGVPDTSPLLIARRAAMNIAPSQGISQLKLVTPGVEWASLPFPGDQPGDSRAMLGYNFALSAAANTKNKPAVLAFLEFAASPDQARELAELSGSASLEQVRDGRLPPELSAYAPLVKQGELVSRLDSQWPTGSTSATIDTAMGGVLTGQQSVSQALDALDSSFGRQQSGQ